MQSRKSPIYGLFREIILVSIDKDKAEYSETVIAFRGLALSKFIISLIYCILKDRL